MTRWVVLAITIGRASATLHAQSTSYETRNAPLLGAAWYPEQWPESRWEHDVALMEQAHFSVVRIGEFAWSSMEPARGRYDFRWLDRAIALAAQHHIAVVLGTPTDAPPAWLTQRYPETLRFSANGRRDTIGMRRQFNYANPLYRRFCARIVIEMARRYGKNPNVIGWQIGNEYTDESFDPATRTMFQQFLRERYKKLEELNARWTTAYWSQTYSDWSQIPLPTGSGNPGLLLEHKHFVTATWRSFQRNQIDALRPLISSHQFITTNIGGLAWSDNWDHYAISEDLDIASWDDYVGSGHLDAIKNAMLDDFVRGWKRENFWIMETQPGFVNWSSLNNALDPGETSAVAWQGVGHGADAILYWQWAPALNGQEQYHGSLVGPDGEPLPLYPEIAKLGADFLRVRAALANTTPHAEIALLHTYDSRWALDFQLHNRNYDQEKVLGRFYAPLRHLAEQRGEAVDIIDPKRGDLARYKLLVAPSLNVIDDELADKLLAWVHAGGTLILGPRSGMKDDNDALDPHRQPGPLQFALGAQVSQFYALDHPVALISSMADVPGSQADTWAEKLRLTSTDTHAVLAYDDPGGLLDQAPAMVERKLGMGTIAYLGTLPSAATLNSIMRRAQSGMTAPAMIDESTSDEVEVAVRSDREQPSARRLIVVINHATSPRKIKLLGTYRDLLEHASIGHLGTQTTVQLPPQGVAVLTMEKP
ncbi:beta-galactosidase [Bryocella elongata]|uniref:Beta-galactosidase n=1 Tax=Bryocella elongata TaxID=863522 RepID=A0A1H6AW84_9BACT|nr:beta-galactosidase [Bryocella elongata]SEG52881.1 beta-galactosidase [Bryocella elongata]